MEPVTTASVVGKTMGVEAFKRLVGDIYGFLKQSAADRSSLTKIDMRPDAIVRKIRQFGKVKTLLNLDKPVDLHTFYYPSSVLIEKTRVVVENYDTIQRDRNLILEGVAGQGKSMLMRHLCLQELSRGSYFPVFAELRDANGDSPIFNGARKYFDILSINLSESLWTILCQSGKLLLLLDGFDEIPEGHRRSVIHELEFLSLKFPDLHIIISSRPNCEIHASPHFEALKVCDLQGDDYAKVIKKLLPDAKTSETLIQKVAKNRNSISGVLNTPLLVTLLVFTYRTFQEIPSRMAEFYDALFQLLLQRHDGMKPTNTRQRRCKLNDSDCRRVFEYFCFVSKLRPKALASESGVIESAKEAIKGTRITADPALFVDDIVRITCLLLKDGDRYRFVHRSVQEYYAACFIAGSPLPVAQKIYENLIVYPDFGNPWEGELGFLSQIDRFRYHQFYILQSATVYFGLPSYENSDENIATVVNVGRQKLLNLPCTLTWRETGELVGSQHPLPNVGVFSEKLITSSAASQIHKAVQEWSKSNFEVVRKLPKLQEIATEGQTKFVATIRIADLMKLSNTQDFAAPQLAKWALSVLASLREADLYIKSQSDTSHITKLLEDKHTVRTNHGLVFRGNAD